METPSTTTSTSIAGPGPFEAEQLFRALVTPVRVQATDEEQSLLASAVPFQVDYRGNRLAAWQWGRTGPRVLVVHGWNSRASHLAGYIRALLAAGYQVLAFDAPGHGQSGGSRSNVVDLGRATLRVLEAAGPVEAAIGHSMGSPALLYAFAQGLQVRASIHIAGPSSLQGALLRAASMARLTDEQADRLLALMEAETGQPMVAMELMELSAGFRHPALILHDLDDREVPFEESRLLRAAWPGSTLHEVSGLGHRRILNDPSLITLGLDMLGRHVSVSRADTEESGS
ncbi:alpha/beta fold hydrolase [Marinobacter lacisalsi]|uniref:Alpha/beta fold hydrolase n=1 Tax=Marinobacter lacisalsi TaxID=475979 RepID=A0ABV8QBP2_9GAMM